jgi:hypothetical protein
MLVNEYRLEIQFKKVRKVRNGKELEPFFLSWRVTHTWYPSASDWVVVVGKCPSQSGLLYFPTQLPFLFAVCTRLHDHGIKVLCCLLSVLHAKPSAQGQTPRFAQEELEPFFLSW